ncbi:MAG: MFS transporter [Pseudomonadota bacterium]
MQTPAARLRLLILMSIAMPIAWATWSALLNNFAIERVDFNGAQMGILQSLREVPGFLAFTTVFVLLLLREQTLAVLALAIMGLGTALTGLLPSEYGLYFTTVLMSIGFHYYETVKQSLSLQWLHPDEAPQLLGRMISVDALTSLIVFAGLFVVLRFLQIDYVWLYLIGGGAVVGMAVYMWVAFPRFGSDTTQTMTLFMRRRYWLYYALTFFSGARRQIFVVFAGFMMVEKFGYSAENIALLFLINHGFNYLFAERIGTLIGRIGERRALIIEYVGLIAVFVGYALVEDARFAVVLYVIDHLFFALAIAMKTYLQKIGDPADMAGTASVSFTINHIAAVVVPAVLGLVWLDSPALVFLFGALFACCSLACALNVPARPAPGNEVLVGRGFAGA